MSRSRFSLDQILSGAIIAAASLLGAMAFLYPFFAPPARTGVFDALSHSQDAPITFLVLVVFCLSALMANLSSGRMNAKLVAVLGLLTAINAVLRFIPGPAGFNAIFFLPILCGYAYGPSFGFLLGVLSLLVSALVGGGVGPWLPYQMLATGWMGLLSGFLPQARLQRWPRAEAVIVALWGFVLGLIFGAMMNIWFWPYVYQPDAGQMYWQPGLGFVETLQHYLVFYAVTSFLWDLARAVGNSLLILLFGAAILRLLRRFQARFQFQIQAVVQIMPEAVPIPSPPALMRDT